MNLLFVTFSDLIAILTAISAIYGYFVVKKSKFIVVEENRTKLINYTDDVEISLRGIKIKTHVYIYNILILFQGENDIRSTDVEQPLTIGSSVIDSRILDIKIIKNTTGRKPFIGNDSKSLRFTDVIGKDGDFIAIKVVVEAKEAGLKFSHRIHNIRSKQDVFYGKIENYWKELGFSFLFLIGLLAFFHYLPMFKDEVIGDKDEIVFSYDIFNNKIEGDGYYKSNKLADSLYFELNRKNYFLKEELTVFDSLLLSFPSDYNKIVKEDIVNSAIYINNRVYYGLVRPPSVRADSLLESLRKENRLRYGLYYSIDKDLKVKIIDEKNRIDLLVIFYYGTFLLSILFAVGFFLAFLSSLKHILLTRSVRKALKQNKF